MGLVCLSNLSVYAHNLCKQLNMLERRTLYMDTGNISLFYFFFLTGNISWSTGQIFSQPPWDFLKKNRAEHITVFLFGNFQFIIFRFEC